MPVLRIIGTGDKMKLNRFQKVLLWLIGISVSLSLILNVVRLSTPFSEISREGYNLFSMIKYSLIDVPVNSVTDFFTSFSQLWQVRQEMTCCELRWMRSLRCRLS